MQKKKAYKIISISLKTGIAALSVWYICQKVFSASPVIQGGLLSEIFSSPSVITLTFVFILMLFNWSLEAIKWRMLISRIEKVSFTDSLRAIFSGITVSIFSPNRTGEFIGRVFFLKKAGRGEATLLTFVGNGAQLSITFFVPVVSFFISKRVGIQNNGGRGHFEEIFYTSTLAGTTCFILMVVLFFAARYFLMRLNNNYLDAIRKMPFRTLGALLLLSLIRYAVFSFQYFLLLGICDVHLSVASTLVAIPLTFLALSAIPTFFLTEIGVRGAAALFFVGIFSDNDEGILTASLLLWLINLAIPALLGLLPVFRLKFFRK